MNTVEILGHLIEVCVDSEKRYRSAASDVGKAKLEQFFNQQCQGRTKTASVGRSKSTSVSRVV
jgi:hypothetical protein